MTELRRTPLYEYYHSHNVKVVDFGGWAMPMQFSSIIKEHEAVRERVGFFDCSHMGEIAVTGPDAEGYLNKIVTNNVTRITDGGVQYNVMCQADGGTIDDVMVYRMNREQYLVVCNASNTDRVWEWMNEHLEGAVNLENQSDQWGLIAVQGPLAEEVVAAITTEDVASIKRHRFLGNGTVAAVSGVIISRTGYTGEDGFELYIPAIDTQIVWEALLIAGEEKGALPCGLGARDTLRLEAGLPLYGQELSATISPLMAGVGFAVKTKKAASFIGQEALRTQREEGLSKKVVGFKLLERGIPRHGYAVFSTDGQEIGEVTSGTQSPTLKQGIGMALIDSAHSEIGNTIMIEVRNKQIPAEIIKKPFI